MKRHAAGPDGAGSDAEPAQRKLISAAAGFADVPFVEWRYRCQCTIIRIVKAKHRKAAF